MSWAHHVRFNTLHDGVVVVVAFTGHCRDLMRCPQFAHLHAHLQCDERLEHEHVSVVVGAAAALTEAYELGVELLHHGGIQILDFVDVLWQVLCRT